MPTRMERMMPAGEDFTSAKPKKLMKVPTYMGSSATEKGNAVTGAAWGKIPEKEK